MEVIRSLPGVIPPVVVTFQAFQAFSSSRRSRPQLPPLLRSWQMVRWPRGAIHGMVVEAGQSRIDWEVCEKSRRISMRSLRSCLMDPLLRGGMKHVVETALLFEISSRAFNRFKLQRGARLLQYWQMDLWLRGAIHTTVVTALQSKISSGMSSRSRPHMLHLLRSWPMDL